MAAESHVSASQLEIEELSTQLFEEANELVAKERRSLASLQTEHASLQKMLESREQQARELERRVRGMENTERGLRERVRAMEGREGEKGKRWEELERRVGRVERVKALLGNEMDGGLGRRVVSVGDVEGKGGAGGRESPGGQ